MAELSIKLISSNAPQTGATPLLQVENLCVRVGIRRVLSSVSFSLQQGDALLIQGGNGTGKSSLLNAIAGLEPARVESGTVKLDGQDITHLPAHKVSQLGIGYLRQRGNVYGDLTVGENLRLALGLSGPDKFTKRFSKWSEQMPLAKRASLLSGGQRQILAWAMVSLRASRLLLADEPEAGLSQKLPSPDTKTLIIVSHSNNWLTSDVP